jgi:hypothetical protein
MMHLTASYLRAHGFCHEGCARFARRYPNGVELTPEWLREHADLLRRSVAPLRRGVARLRRGESRLPQGEPCL